MSNTCLSDAQIASVYNVFKAKFGKIIKVECQQLILLKPSKSILSTQLEHR